MQFDRSIMKKRGIIWLATLTLIGGMFLTGCSSSYSDKPGDNTSAEAESVAAADESNLKLAAAAETYWEASAPEAQGMDSALLTQMYEDIASSKLDVHHVLILKNGYKVSEANYYPYAATDLHILNSVTKSFTSALIGKAIDEKLIAGVDQPVLDFFKSRTIANPSAFKDNMILKDLLTMTSGIDWSETGNYGASTDSNTQMWQSENQIQFMLDKAVTKEPGSTFYYCSGGTHLMSGILTEVTGQSEEQYATEKLFKPLGIENYTWGLDNQGNNSGSSRLFLSASDLAKFGELYRNKGNWNGEQLIPEAWVEASTQKLYDTPNGPSSQSGYGYQWWMNPFGGYSARGFGGQFLYVVPDLDLVVVFMGSMGSTFFAPDRLMTEYVLPAVNGDAPLPENKVAQEALSAMEQKVLEAPAATETPALNDTAKGMSGQIFTVENGDKIGVDFVEGSSEATLHWTTDGETYDVPVGLDGIYRFSPCSGFYLKGYTSNVGFTGKWTTDRTFIITVCPTDGDATYTLALTYDKGILKSTFRSNLTGR